MWSSWVAYAVWMFGGWLILNFLYVVFMYVFRAGEKTVEPSVRAVTDVEYHFPPRPIHGCDHLARAAKFSAMARRAAR